MNQKLGHSGFIGHVLLPPQCHCVTVAPSSAILTGLPSNPRPNTRDLVTSGHFWSCGKDGGYWVHHLICHSRKPHYTSYMQTSWLYVYRTGVMADWSYTLWEYTFLTFCSCDLDPYSLDWMCKYEFLTSRLSKVTIWHTDLTEIIYHAASRVVSYVPCPRSYYAYAVLIIMF